MKNTFLSAAFFTIVLMLGITSSCTEQEQKELSYDEIIADFMFQYNKLTPEQVNAVVGTEPLTFAGSEKSPGYKLLLDDSASLLVPEGTACLRLNNLTLNVLRVENSLTFYLAVVDERTKLATVFETWFCGEFGFGSKPPPREVERYIATGYIAGNASPDHRHKATKRLIGKVIQWTDELTVFGSPSYSAQVPKGSMQTFCYPSDYYELDERYWLYSRVEVEFSGGFVLDVIDLYTMKKMGVKLGIDAQDKFVCEMYSDTGKIRGQLAAYYPFGIANQNPVGFVLPPPAEGVAAPPVMKIPKGMRFLYRPSEMTQAMTLAEVAEVAAKTKAWKGAFDFPGKEKKMMEHSAILDNRKFTVTLDNGTILDYEIGTDFNMRFREGTGEWKSERYDAFEADDQLVFFAHTTNNDCPIDGLQYAIDLKNGLVTLVRSTFDNEKSPRDPRQQWLFGIIKADGITPYKEDHYFTDEQIVDTEFPELGNIFSKERHHFTDELIGRSYTWEYSDDVSSQHVYTTTESFTYAIISNSEASVMGSFPCKYIKIREGVYMLSWIEMRSQGIMGLLLFNTKTMHDCGTCHGMTHDQTFEFNTFGAESRGAGRYE